MRIRSLRARLILIILTPLLLISLVAGNWQFRNATQRAEDIFDRGLLSAALAISRDVAVSGGDALSPETRALVSDTSGGELFYHVYAPDGVFVTGYATPPVAPGGLRAGPTAPLFYDANYQGQGVRVLRFQDVTTVDGVSGLFNITVWQRLDVRTAFVRDVVVRAFGVIAALVLSVALVVWFGVNLGLRPLLDLQDAIAKRSPNQLDPIRRVVPVETRGLVETLNLLLDRVSRRISSKDEFIASAAHQLRNPIAGVLALAEAVQNAPTEDTARERSAELVQAARDASHLTNQLLSFERAKGTDTGQFEGNLALGDLLAETCQSFAPQAGDAGISVQCTCPDAPVTLRGDRVMLREAVLNLMTNALVHGGPGLSRIDLSLTAASGQARIAIEDDGRGISDADRAVALGRFGQANAGPGSGLGLPIAARVAENHGGTLEIEACKGGARIVMTLPLDRPSATLSET